MPLGSDLIFVCCPTCENIFVTFENKLSNGYKCFHLNIYKIAPARNESFRIYRHNEMIQYSTIQYDGGSHSTRNKYIVFL